VSPQPVCLTGAHATPQIFGWSKKMSAIALLDVSGADASFSELVTRARAAAAQWAAEHPGLAAPAMATVATPPLQVQHPGTAPH
jgi:hypothetical protein